MKVLIYSKEDCPYCVKAKLFLQSNNINYEEKVVGQDLTSEEYREIVGSTHKTVPGIFFDEKFIGGYSELLEYAYQYLI